MPAEVLGGPSPSSQTVLRQAQERTQLVVDCAGLVRRLEALDAEIKAYDQWQRYPNSEYNMSVQQRFEEARLREAEEASRRPGASGLSGQLPLRSMGKFHGPGSPAFPSPLSPRAASPHASSEDQESKLAVAHLQRALRAADYEASIWRERALDMETASEREREEAKRLMDFELAKAIQTAERERESLLGQIKERDAAFEKVESEYRSLNQDHDAMRETIGQAEARLEVLASASAAKDAQLSAVQAEKEQAWLVGHKYEAKAKRLEGELQHAYTERDAKQKLVDSAIAEAKRQEAEFLHVCVERDQKQKALDTSRMQAARLEGELMHACSERDAKQNAFESSQAQVVMLSDIVKTQEAKINRFESEAGTQEVELKAARGQLETKAAELRAARDQLSTQEADLKTAMAELGKVRVHVTAQQALLDEQAFELEQVRVECERKHQAALEAQKRLEIYIAKSDNLEAALANATAKQADAALQRDVHKDRADVLERQLDEARGPARERKARLLESLNSTMTSSVASPASTRVPMSPEDINPPSPKSPAKPLAPVKVKLSFPSPNQVEESGVIQ
eukprot:TRINITY_DN36127_c0_g1_i1.p1 TRINITY_DN36127_c0_g1~~TRINITY_DN36127_c0_g1_i1.p1  ORF type:complete len:568 (+),score=162.84 TRINITY_DN36127_c0_g1_i1:106-1809(+)